MTAASPDEFRRQLGEWIPPRSDVAIVDVPVHRNAGDLFILAATNTLLQHLECRVVYRAGIRDYSPARARRYITSNTILVGLGGGNFGDLYPAYQAHRERIVADFPGNRIVILPQTLHFSDSRRLARTAARMRTHQDFRLVVRDRRSQKSAEAFTPYVRLLPDTVHALGPAIVRAGHPEEPGAGTLVLERRDREGHRPIHKSGGRDWPDILPGFRARLLGAALLMPFAPPDVSVRLHGWWARYAASVLERSRLEIARAEHVVTDRLHAAILARVVGRTVTLHDRGYGKLAAYYETWWRDDPALELRRG